MPGSFDNWARNLSYSARKVHFPTSVEQVQSLVASSAKVKALGSRHSFSDVADTDGDLICLDRLNKIVSLDLRHSRVTVEGGIRYGELSRWLQGEGFGLPNMASLPHISVAGACATATHGSGDLNGNLATSVAAIDLVTADGQLRTVRREDTNLFEGCVVSLGAIGVAVRVTLDVHPSYMVGQLVYEDLALGDVLDNFDAITASAYSVSLFTDWKDSRINLVWQKHLTERTEPLLYQPDFFGGKPVTENRHPIPGHPSESCTEQMGVPGPWNDRLPHFKMEFTPSSGEELQSEFLVPRPNAVDALIAVNNLKERISPLLQICEIRTIAADGQWMSPCFEQPCVGVHFTWKKDWGAVSELLPEIEAELAGLGARPHWGKLFTLGGDYLASAYPHIGDFRRLAESLDPQRKFHNRFLESFVFVN
jgi:xylitol oxidase